MMGVQQGADTDVAALALIGIKSLVAATTWRWPEEMARKSDSNSRYAPLCPEHRRRTPPKQRPSSVMALIQSPEAASVAVSSEHAQRGWSWPLQLAVGRLADGIPLAQLHSTAGGEAGFSQLLKVASRTLKPLQCKRVARGDHITYMVVNEDKSLMAILRTTNSELPQTLASELLQEVIGHATPFAESILSHPESGMSLTESFQPFLTSLLCKHEFRNSVL